MTSAPTDPDEQITPIEELRAIEFTDLERTPYELKPALKLIAFLAAHGRDSHDISEETGIDAGYIHHALDSTRVKDEIKRVQESYFSAVKDRFSNLALKGIDFFDKVMTGAEPASNKDKIAVAKESFNRAYGKAIERVQVESSTIRQLFEMLDKKQNMVALPPTSPEHKKGTQIIEAEATVVEEQKPKGEYDDLDDWVDKNAPHKGIGKGI